MQNLTREQLIKLVEDITNCQGTEDEIDEMIRLLEKNVPHPEVSDLIFWEDGKTPEQIIEFALNYKPIIL